MRAQQRAKQGRAEHSRAEHSTAHHSTAQRSIVKQARAPEQLRGKEGARTRRPLLITAQKQQSRIAGQRQGKKGSKIFFLTSHPQHPRGRAPPPPHYNALTAELNTVAGNRQGEEKGERLTPSTGGVGWGGVGWGGGGGGGAAASSLQRINSRVE